MIRHFAHAAALLILCASSAMAQTADEIVCINMIHVAPWSATLALLESSKALLTPEHVLFLYGPYRSLGRHTTLRSSMLIFVRSIPTGVFATLRRSPRLLLRLVSCWPR